MRRVLGIDPGSRITGLGIIEQTTNGKSVCLFAGSITLTAKEMPARLGKLLAEVQEVVKIFKPTEVAIEEVFVHKNVRSALILGQARGVALASAMNSALPVFEYAARQVKQAIVGRGNADKAQIQHMIQILLNLGQKPQADAADALAVALCHLHTVTHIHLLANNVPSRRRHNKRATQWKSYDRTTSR